MPDKIHAKVLLVDDEEQFLNILSERLRDRGLEVSNATSGEEAIQQVKVQDFDVVVVDLVMPGMDGIETIRRIKEVNPNTEIIMLTGHGTVKSGIEVMKLGAEEFLEKPIDINILLEKIKDLRHHDMLFEKKL